MLQSNIDFPIAHHLYFPTHCHCHWHVSKHLFIYVHLVTKGLFGFFWVGLHVPLFSQLRSDRTSIISQLTASQPQSFKNGIRDACSTVVIFIHCYPLFSIVVNCCQLLSIVINCCQLLSIVVHCYPLLSMAVFNSIKLFAAKISKSS